MEISVSNFVSAQMISTICPQLGDHKVEKNHKNKPRPPAPKRVMGLLSHIGLGSKPSPALTVLSVRTICTAMTRGEREDDGLKEEKQLETQYLP